MAVDMFITIGDIKGESIDDKHKDQIEVLSWNWGMSQSGTSHSGAGGGTGKVDVQNLVFNKFVDKSSPALIKSCCKGTHFDKAVLTVRKAGGDALEYLKIELFNGIIAQVSVGGSGGPERLTETIGLNFAAFKYSYVPQTAKGAGGAAVPASWNIATNTENV